MQIQTHEFFQMIGMLYVENWKLKELVTAYRTPVESNNGAVRNQQSAAQERTLSRSDPQG